MGKLSAIFVLIFVASHAIHARNMPADVGHTQQELAIAPTAASPSGGNGIDDKKNFVYGGVGGFAGVGGGGGMAGMGGYAGVAGGLPLVGGLGGAAGIGGLTGLGVPGSTLGGAGGLGGGSGLGGAAGIGGAVGSGLPGPTGIQDTLHP